MVVQNVEISKKKYPVFFGFNALRIYCDITGKAIGELDNLSETLTLGDAVTLIWCGLKDGARKKEKEFNLTMDELSDEFDSDMEALTRCLEVFAKFQSKQGGDQGNVEAGAN